MGVTSRFNCLGLFYKTNRGNLEEVESTCVNPSLQLGFTLTLILILIIKYSMLNTHIVITNIHWSVYN